MQNIVKWGNKGIFNIILNLLLLFVLSLVFSFELLKINLKFFAILQQNNYLPLKTFKWWVLSKLKNDKLFYLLTDLLFFVVVVNLFIYYNLPFYFYYCLFLGVVCYLFVLLTAVNIKNLKVKFVLTARMKRLLCLTAILQTMFLYFSLVMMCAVSINFFYMFLCFMLFSPLVYVLAVFLILPFEKLIKKFYILKAKNKLKQFKNLTVIAITGSYGKTSTKKYLFEVLKQKYSVCISPNSYNTEMGITKTILNELKPYHQILILEFGADRKNDIKKLCNIVSPDISVVTSVGQQHLKTFKTIDNIIKTKYQIVEGTKHNGLFVTNIDNDICKNFFNKTKINKLAVSKFDNGCYCYLNGFSETKSGLKMNCVLNNEILELSSSLLGEFNVDNILIVVSIAKHLGLSNFEIKNAICNLKAVSHRLELKQLNNGAVVVDDSFNSNPVGAAVAINTIKKIATKTIVVTCGMVELGELQYKLNFEFGVNLAVVDVVIVVNDLNFAAINNGLKSVCDKQIIKFNDFLSAYNYAVKNSNENTAILIENDLTDLYIV